MPKLSTPWGQADVFVRLDPDKKVVRVATPSQGGIGVHPSLELAAHIEACAIVDSEGWRWFEDSGCAAVIVALPQLFSRSAFESAKLDLQHSQPETYMTHFGTVLTATTSRALEQREFESATRNKYTVVAAFGDWAWDVPQGSVYCCGWRNSDEATAGFLVPADHFYQHATRLILDDFPRWEPNRKLPYSKLWAENAVNALE